MTRKALYHKTFHRKPKFGVRGYTRGRLCFRELAHAGEIPGV
jgi:ribosomal protein S14